MKLDDNKVAQEVAIIYLDFLNYELSEDWDQYEYGKNSVFKDLKNGWRMEYTDDLKIVIVYDANDSIRFKGRYNDNPYLPDLGIIYWKNGQRHYYLMMDDFNIMDFIRDDDIYITSSRGRCKNINYIISDRWSGLLICESYDKNGDPA